MPPFFNPDFFGAFYAFIMEMTAGTLLKMKHLRHVTHAPKPDSNRGRCSSLPQTPLTASSVSGRQFWTYALSNLHPTISLPVH